MTFAPYQRIVDWFGHYLKGQPAPPWIATGVTFLDKDKARTSGSSQAGGERCGRLMPSSRA